jgi:mannose-6-phosphate isomerase-like protein (cupin superfamily)
VAAREQVASLTLIRPPLSRGQIDKLRTELGENPDITLDPEEYGMHQTQTIDFVTIVSGEVDLRLDDAEVHLKAGDCVIQRGTRHAWRNRSTEPCVLSAVLVSTKRP